MKHFAISEVIMAIEVVAFWAKLIITCVIIIAGVTVITERGRD